ncbi:MAG: hypothetical protein V4678_01560 [Patescibacteria group bacterium]
MRRLLVAAFAVSGLLSFAAYAPVGALGLKVAPLQYKTILKEAERQQGFVDISNPSTQAVSVRTSVQAFKQINNDGGLQFYDDKQVQVGISVELEAVELGPREAARVAFTIDGNALPEGNVFAAIFFTIEPKQPTNGVGQSVRVGTLLSVVNDSPGPRQAQITDFDLPLLQLDETAKGAYRIRNTGAENTGFYPTVNVSSWFGGKSAQIESSLVFGARERSNDISYRTGYGLHRVEISHGNSTKSQWVIAVAPWMLVAGLLVIFVIGIELLLLRKRRKSTHGRTSRSKRPTS